MVLQQKIFLECHIDLLNGITVLIVVIQMRLDPSFIYPRRAVGDRVSSPSSSVAQIAPGRNYRGSDPQSLGMVV
jgi:hypothetical protein